MIGRDLRACTLDIEPFGTVDFGKALPAIAPRCHSISKVLLVSSAGSKWPSPANAIARFPPRCRTSASCCKPTNRRAGAEFLGKLGPRHHFCERPRHRFRPLGWTRRHAPGRTARIDEQHFDPARALQQAECRRSQSISSAAKADCICIAPPPCSNMRQASLAPDLKHVTIASGLRRGCELVADFALVAESGEEEDAPAALNASGLKIHLAAGNISGPSCCTRRDQLSTSISYGRSLSARA
jgi:hypothetical protein